MHFLLLPIFLICFTPSINAEIQDTSAVPQTMTDDQVKRLKNKRSAIEKEISGIEKSSPLLNSSEVFSEQSQPAAQEKIAAISQPEKSTENIQKQLDKLKLDINKINSQMNNTVNEEYNFQFRESIRILDKNIIVDNNLLAILIALLSTIIAFSAFIFALRAKKKAIKNAKKNTETHFRLWLEEKESEIVNHFLQKTESLHKKTLTLLDERLFTAQKTAAELGCLSDLYQSLTAQYENDIRFRLTQFDQISDPDDIKKFDINLNKRLMHREKVDYSSTDSFDQAIVAFHQKDYLTSISFLGDVINNPESSDLLLTNALFNKAYTLQKCQRTAKAIAVYDQIISLFSDSTELFFEVQINQARIYKALALSETDATVEVLTLYDDLVSRLEQRSELEMQQIVAQALFNKSNYLTKIGQQKQSIAGYESVVSLFSDSVDLKLQTLVTQSLGHLLTIFDKQEKPLAVIKLCDKIHLLFAQRHELIFKQLVAQALEDKAIILLKFNKAKDAIKLFDEIIARFGKSNSHSLKAKVNNALTNAALVSLITEEFETTKFRIQQAEKVNRENSLNFVVMSFVHFLIDDTTVEKFIENAEKLAPDTKFNCSFAILKNFIKRLPQVKQRQANAAVDFFENHHNISKLKNA
jgi:tetratricopeptide (TPR) repeat protein